MFIVLTYDVGKERISKILKICRKYMTHVQKSVFEGFLDEKKLSELKKDIEKIICKDEDQVAIYKFKGAAKPKKEIIGCHIEKDNII